MEFDVNIEIMKPKKNEQIKILCKRCSFVTNHALQWERVVNWGDDDIQGTDKHQVLLCKGCESVTYRIASINSEDYCFETGEYFESHVCYPDRRLGMINCIDEVWRIPHKVKDVYEEAIGAYNSKQLILCSIGVRCIVEAVCLDKGIKKGKLNVKIDELKDKGLITQLLSDGLHQIRSIGNDGAHDIDASNESDLRIAMDLINNLIIECYFSPDKVLSLKARKSK